MLTDFQQTICRLTICGGLLAAVSACAPPGPARMPALAQLDVPDHYAFAPPAADSAHRCDSSNWAQLFDDPILANLVSRADAPAERAEIATAYFGVRLAQARITDTHARLATLAELQQVAHFRARARLVTDRDPLQIEAEQARLSATLPQFEAEIASRVARIAVLTGRSPSDIRDWLSGPAAIPVGPADVQLGKPSDLLARRDELRRAGKRFDFAGWPFTPSYASEAAYRRAILSAQADVEKALAAFESAKAHEAALFDALAKGETLIDLMRRQYRDGLADYATLTSQESALAATRDDLNMARADRADALVRLCLALGADETAEDEKGARNGR